MAKSSINNKKIGVKEKNDARNPGQVSQAKVFWCNDGQVFAGLKDLAEGLDRMSDDTFAYHCNPNKDDFSIWVEEVVGDEDLAKNLKNLKNRQRAHKQVKQRYSDLTRLEG